MGVEAIYCIICDRCRVSIQIKKPEMFVEKIRRGNLRFDEESLFDSDFSFVEVDIGNFVILCEDCKRKYMDFKARIKEEEKQFWE